ncbi:MAG: helix-turn-helix domain-containing protein [Halieaceae bacterium]|jgi:AcrR family transcriptional regulator|nr:helix-turn-helix domain-containing protein [Halieaceae bacterium]
MTDVLEDRPLSRSAQREADILEAAIHLFGEEGFHSVTTRKIAARAGISEGTLFNYFSSKNELMRAILERIYEELRDKASAILREQLDSRLRLQLLAENHIEVMSRDNALFMRMIQAYMNVDLAGYTSIRGSVLHKLNLSYAWVFDTAVQEAQRRGEVRQDLNLSALRDLFFGGLEYLSRSLFLHEAFDQMSERVSSVVEPLWQSMLPATATKPDRLEDACQRIEAAARKLEKQAGRQ